MPYEPPAPDRCRNGHVYAPFKVLVGFRHCRCDGAVTADSVGHVTYRCRIDGCDDVIAVGCTDASKETHGRRR